MTNRILVVALTLCAIVEAKSVVAQETARVTVTSDSKLTIDGTSNLHSWSCKAERLDAAIDVDRAAVADFAEAAPKSLKRVEVKVPVKSIKCGHGGMDDNLYKALKADDSPDVSYILASFDAVPGDAKDTFTLKTIGTLTIAGKEKSVAMDIEATRLPDGTIKATGLVPLKMTDYGITPPTAIFGRLKTGDDVKVSFELTVGAKAIAAALTEPR